VYEDVHVGNAKTYAVWDVLFRVLKHFGYNVKHVQNFTDVGHLTDDADTGDDKIQKKAEELNEHPMELVDTQIKEYHESMDKVRIHRPNVAPRATSHISEMIQMVKVLIDKGFGYEIEGDQGTFYYDTSKFDDYGKLAKLDLEGQQTGSRDEVKVIEGKRNPSDFALWIRAPEEHIMKYVSPVYGTEILGYPGWHLECSVMAQKYLGDTIDIHAGGIDHIPVHHTNEIAQSEAATGQKFARYWLHSEFVTINGEKMSKSKNNFITLHDLIEEVGPGPAKMSLIQANYRTQADFSMDKAKAIRTRYLRLIRSYHFARQIQVIEDLPSSDKYSEDFMGKFDDALADDLNTPEAFTVVNELAKALDNAVENADFDHIPVLINTFETMMDVLGIPYVKLDKDEVMHVNGMVEHRLELRKNKQWEASDAIRDYLSDDGYNLNDVSGRTEWFKPDPNY